MATIDNLVSIVKELISFFEELTKTESEKLKAVTETDMEKLDECMKKEQAAILKLRGLDKKREDIQSQLSFSGLTFSQILEKLPQDEKLELQTYFDRLNTVYKAFKNADNSAKKAIEVNLYSIDRILGDFNKKLNRNNTPKDITYNGQGIGQSSVKSFTSRKV